MKAPIDSFDPSALSDSSQIVFFQVRWDAEKEGEGLDNVLLDLRAGCGDSAEPKVGPTAVLSASRGNSKPPVCPARSGGRLPPDGGIPGDSAEVVEMLCLHYEPDGCPLCGGRLSKPTSVDSPTATMVTPEGIQ